MARKTRIVFIAAVVSAASVALWGCSHKSPSGEQAGGLASSMPGAAGAPKSFGGWGIDLTKLPGTRFRATVADNVIRIDADTVKRAARGVNRDHNIYFFENLPGLQEKFVPGRVVLLEGLTFKRVQAVANDGSQIIVATEDAAITDLYSDADIAWSVPIHFQEIQSQRARAKSAAAVRQRFDLASLLEQIEPRVYAAPDENTENGDGDDDGWKYHFEHKFTPDRLDFTIQLNRSGTVADVTEMDVQITGKGYVQNFESSLSMAINGGKMNQFGFSNKNVNGAVDFDWTAGVPGTPPKDMGEERIKLPAIMSVPFLVGEVPFTLEIGEALLFHPGFSAKLEIAKGSFHVDYNGVTGLKVTSNEGDSSGQDTSQATADTAIQSSTASSPLAAFGVVIALAMPRFELKTGAEELLNEVPASIADTAAALLDKTTIGHYIKKQVNKLKPEGSAYFQVILSSTASHSGMLSLVPCQRFTLHTEGQVGAEASGFGLSKDAGPFKVFTKDIDQPVPAGKICTGSSGPAGN